MSVFDVRQRMLDGWVLTALPCPNPGCRVPLMHSPPGTKPVTHFCPSCDDSPDAASSTSTESRPSHVSTPLTEVSNLSESPIIAPLLDTEESRRRRAQSDRASQELGNRLLQGWTMLADECPGANCYGVPLVRPPKAGGEKDPKKECVICGVVYSSEVGQAGRQRLVPWSANGQLAVTSRAEVSSETRSEAQSQKPKRGDLSSRSIDPCDTSKTLQESSKALQSTLHFLSTRLESLSAPGMNVDPTSISSIADAMLKVTQALSQVKQLEWSERQTRLQ